MAKKDGMYLYNDWLVPFEKLESREVGELVVAMMRYFIYGEEPPRFTGLCGMAADFIFPQIDRSMEYSNLGTRAKGVSKSKKEQPHSHIEIEEEKPRKRAKKKEEPKAEDEKFKRFWRVYPNKSEKQQAEEIFAKLSPDDSLMETILAALEKQKATYRWQKEDGRYIPFPANWLEGRRWEDEIGNDEIDPYSYGSHNDCSNKKTDASFETDDFFEAAVRRSYEL